MNRQLQLHLKMQFLDGMEYLIKFLSNRVHSASVYLAVISNN